MEQASDTTGGVAGQQPNLSSRARVSAIARQSASESARAAGDDNSLWVSATSMCMSINKRWLISSAPIAAYEWDMHDLWHTYYQAAKHTPAESPKQDRLVIQVIQAREQGVLKRPTRSVGEQYHGGQVMEEAITSGGTIWTDLPFLADDMTEYWRAECAPMSSAQRLNFAQFLAKLASAGVVEDRLCGISLIVLREALETSRPLGRLQRDDENALRGMEDVSVATLLPAVGTWLGTAGRRIIQLAERNWHGCPCSVGTVGHLATSEVPRAGFSTERWLYWLGRLGELIGIAAQAGEGGIAELCERIVETMLITADETASSVRNSLEQQGRLAQFNAPIGMMLGASGINNEESREEDD